MYKPERGEYHPDYLKKLKKCTNILEEMNITSLKGYDHYFRQLTETIATEPLNQILQKKGIKEKDLQILGISPEVVFEYLNAIETKQV